MKLALILLCLAFILQDAILISLHLKLFNLRRKVIWLEEEVGLLLDGYSEEA